MAERISTLVKPLPKRNLKRKIKRYTAPKSRVWERRQKQRVRDFIHEVHKAPQAQSVVTSSQKLLHNYRVQHRHRPSSLVPAPGGISNPHSTSLLESLRHSQLIIRLIVSYHIGETNCRIRISTVAPLCGLSQRTPKQKETRHFLPTICVI
jgi:hypothetical protein